jgi:hypothetical protein
MKRYLVLGFLALSFLSPGPVGAAQDQERWELLGRQQVDFRGDRDRIQVGRHEGKFRQIQVRVQGAPVEIHDMVITFGNNEKFSPPLRHRFDERSNSRVIDLPGERRTIRNVEFNYRSTERREGKATVAVYAR